MKSFRNFSKEFFRVIASIKISMLAAQISFFLLLAFFPFCILLLLLLGRIQVDDTLLLQSINSFLPSEIAPLFSDIIKNAGENMNVFWSVAGFVTTAWVSTRAAHGMISAVDSFYKRTDRWPWTHRLGLAAVMTLSLVLFIVLSMLFVLFGRQAMIAFVIYIGKDPASMSAIWGILRITGAILALTAFFTVLYTISVKSRIKIRQVLPGAVFSAILWFLLTYAFSLIITNFFIYTSIYGSLGSIILMMMWLYWGAHIILIGAAINKTNQNLRDPHTSKL